MADGDLRVLLVERVPEVEEKMRKAPKIHGGLPRCSRAVLPRTICSYCDQEFLSRNALFRHLREEGVDTSPLHSVCVLDKKCVGCGDVHENLDDLETHMKYCFHVGRRGSVVASRDFDFFEESGECVVCLGSAVSSILMPCKHACMCTECAVRVTTDPMSTIRTPKCPLCRSSVCDVLQFETAPPSTGIPPLPDLSWIRTHPIHRSPARPWPVPHRPPSQGPSVLPTTRDDLMRELEELRNRRVVARAASTFARRFVIVDA